MGNLRPHFKLITKLCLFSIFLPLKLSPSLILQSLPQPSQQPLHAPCLPPPQPMHPLSAARDILAQQKTNLRAPSPTAAQALYGFPVPREKNKPRPCRSLCSQHSHATHPLSHNPQGTKPLSLPETSCAPLHVPVGAVCAPGSLHRAGGRLRL